jgi:hypothetical protein
MSTLGNSLVIETLFREGITETAIAKQNKVTNNKWKWFISLTLYFDQLALDNYDQPPKATD